MYRYRDRHQQMDQEPLDRWLVSYADYVTLMFALFVVLYSLAIAKEEKFKTISTTLSQVFEKPPVPETGVKGPDVLTDNKPRSDYQKFGTSLETATGPEIVADAKEQMTQQDPKFGNPLVSLQEQLTQSLANLIEQGVAKVETDDDWLTIQLNSGLLFPSGSAVQTSSAEVLLKEIVGILNQSANIIRVRGYTDNQPMSNEIFPSNWELSMARATAILRELQRLGVRPQRLAAEGYGEFAPFADNNTEAGRAENRKVVIAISKFAARPLNNQQQIPAEATPEQVEQILQQATKLPAEDGTIHVIRLPHGGIRITAAPQTATDNTEKRTGIINWSFGLLQIKKGGVGKTTTTVTLGALLAERGNRVLLIDTDPHASLTYYFGIDAEELENSVYDIFIRGKNISKEEIMQSLCPSGMNNLDILPSSMALATLDRSLGDKGGMGLILKKALAKIADEYDYVLIDCPPVIGVLMVNAMAACDRILIPVQTEFLALKGLDRMLATMQLMQTNNQPGYQFTIVPTMYDKRTKASLEAYKELKAKYQDLVWSAVIPIDTKMRDASLAQTPPPVYAPKSRGVFAYNTLLTYLLQLSPESVHE